MSENKINHPSHYTIGAIEVIDAIEEWELGFHLGNVVKYISRAAHKGKLVEDLEKALWYLKRYRKLVERPGDPWFSNQASWKITPAQAADAWRLGPDMTSVVAACATGVGLKKAAETLAENILLIKETE